MAAVTPRPGTVLENHRHCSDTGAESAPCSSRRRRTTHRHVPRPRFRGKRADASPGTDQAASPAGACNRSQSGRRRSAWRASPTGNHSCVTRLQASPHELIERWPRVQRGGVELQVNKKLSSQQVSLAADAGLAWTRRSCATPCARGAGWQSESSSCPPGPQGEEGGSAAIERGLLGKKECRRQQPGRATGCSARGKDRLEQFMN
eukprot:scaffold3690_cov113-Isochrysis_galbana.AAC.2